MDHKMELTETVGRNLRKKKGAHRVNLSYQPAIGGPSIAPVPFPNMR